MFNKCDLYIILLLITFVMNIIYLYIQNTICMKNRIKQIMDNEDMSPAQFADRLNINRAVISHILNGRNNPSLDVVTKILSDFDYINPEWLINGKGSIYKEGHSESSTLIANERDLFNQNDVNSSIAKSVIENSKEKGVKDAFIDTYDAAKQQDSVNIIRNRKITQIIIYYDDNTFETFNTHSN